MKKPTQNALLQVLEKFGRRPAHRPSGEGWFTLEELAAEEGRGASPAAIKYRIQQAQKRGVMVEIAAGTALDADGRAKRTAYYRLKNGKPG